MTARHKNGVCWECGKQFYGNHYVEAVYVRDTHPRRMHKACFTALQNLDPSSWSDVRRFPPVKQQEAK